MDHSIRSADSVSPLLLVRAEVMVGALTGGSDRLGGCLGVDTV